MKINSLSDTSRLGTIQATGTGKTAVAGKAADAAVVAKPAEPGVTATLRQDGDFDASKVAEIKAAIREGRFQVNAEVVAGKLLASANELLGPRH
jgi:negative regulator of flagellin synthesis FlgM